MITWFLLLLLLLLPDSKPPSSDDDKTLGGNGVSIGFPDVLGTLSGLNIPGADFCDVLDLAELRGVCSFLADINPCLLGVIVLNIGS